MTNTFSKVTGYKNQCKNKRVAFLYTNNEPQEKEIRTIPSHISLKLYSKNKLKALYN
jgi:hypothetical protein